jgi:hypothetical protein
MTLSMRISLIGQQHLLANFIPKFLASSVPRLEYETPLQNVALT